MPRITTVRYGLGAHKSRAPGTGPMTTISCGFGTSKSQTELRKLYPPASAQPAAQQAQGEPAALPPVAATDADAPPSAAYVDDSPFENGHAPLKDQFAEHRAGWAAMNAKQAAPEVGREFWIGLIADQDEASHIAEKVWESYLAYGKLKYLGDLAEGSYSLVMMGEAPVDTDRGDKSKRGAEYSALEVFDGKLLTFCDRSLDLHCPPPLPFCRLVATSVLAHAKGRVARVVSDLQLPWLCSHAPHSQTSTIIRRACVCDC
jgi:hypothetical protein